MQMLFVASITAMILLIPLIAMDFTSEVNWNGLDFLVMAMMLMGAGLTYVFIANLSSSYAYKLGVAITMLTSFLLVWVLLAVGMIGASGHPANLLYGLVFITLGASAFSCKFTAQGLSKSLFRTAAAQFIVPFIAIIFWQPILMSEANLVRLLIFNSVFALLFAGAGWLFRKSAKSLVTKV